MGEMVHPCLGADEGGLSIPGARFLVGMGGASCYQPAQYCSPMIYLHWQPN